MPTTTTEMTLERDEIMVHRTNTTCNPQEDSHHGKKISPEPAPWPNESEKDLPPWSQLEQMKKEANEVAMHSFPMDEQPTQRKAIITVISGGRAVCDSDTLAKGRKSNKDAADYSHPFDDIVDDQGFPKEPLTLYTSFAKEVGYVYPFEGGFGTASSTKSMRHNNSSNNGEEHTVENFNQFLEISSMTTNSVDHALAMGKKDPKLRQPENAVEMADAPSGILMVFDRLLDCIDPKEKRAFLQEEEESFGFETDQSSTSWLETQLQLDELSIVTDEGSLFRFDVQSDWLDDSLDCIFPCWKDPQVCDEILPKQPSQRALAKAVSRKRAAKEPTKEEKDVALEEKSQASEAKSSSELKENEDEPFDFPPPELSQASEAKPPSEPNENNDDDPFDFPPPEFPPPVWKKPIELDSDTLESDESSLPEVFQGLPSDEKEERVRELHTYLDQTSATEETSTLSYSDGTL